MARAVRCSRHWHRRCDRHYRTAGMGLLAVAVAGVALSSGFVGNTALADIPGMHSFAGQGSYYGLVHRERERVPRLRPIDATSDSIGVPRAQSRTSASRARYMLLRHHAVLANEFFSESQTPPQLGRSDVPVLSSPRSTSTGWWSSAVQRRVPDERTADARRVGRPRPGERCPTHAARPHGVRRDGRSARRAPAPASVKDCGRL